MDENKPWDRIYGVTLDTDTGPEDEPVKWYSRFFNYYLIIPPPERTLKAAYLRWREDKGRPVKPIRKAPLDWELAATRWVWKERADAFDKWNRDKALKVVSHSAIRLMLLTDAAVTRVAQILETGTDKTALAAANSIFDRGGLPKRTEVGIGEAESRPITPEEIKVVDEEIEDWTRKTFGGSS